MEFFQAIIGADYGFENGITLVAEALYTSERFDFGTTLSYSFTLFLEGSIGYIESFNTHNSRFITPVLTYTLNDFNSFCLGAMLQNGDENSEFGMFSNTYYINYSLERIGNKIGEASVEEVAKAIEGLNEILGF